MKPPEIDPRVKLIMLIIISTSALATREIMTLAAIFAVTLLILSVIGVSFLDALRRCRSMLGLILSLFVIQCVFDRSGEPLLAIGEFTFLRTGGLNSALTVSIRLAIITASAMIVMTGEPRDYILALTQCKVPYEIAFMTLAALRFIPILREEATNVLCAVQMRGTKLRKTGLVHKLRVYLSIMIPVTARAVRRSEQLALAMEARGFRAKPERTSMRALSFGRLDWIVLAGFSLLMALVLWVQLGSSY